jgi:hypothetical protein
MGCCGSTKANLSYSRVSRQSATAGRVVWSRLSAIAAVLPRSHGQAVALRYVGKSKIVVRGPATGVSYAFSLTEPVHEIDVRDAGVFLRTGSFRLIRNS